MIMEALRGVLGAPPVPQGSWEREARFVSTAALRGTAEPAAEAAERLAERLRATPGVRQVDVRPNGFLVIGIAAPGEIVHDILAAPPAVSPPETGPEADSPAPWPDFPRTWDNPGFAVRYAYVRAGAVQRWARDLGVPAGAAARPELLDGPFDRAVLRVLAELPSRRDSRDPGWAAYLERLAEVYHAAVERASPIPKGDEPPTEVHAARVRMGEAVRRVLGEGLAELGMAPPGKI
ncbi:DALR anticodon-binding domain-containing protein [Microbispora sp. KK1-11]|uniref:DALR anticodon-binding domain-containing protein n=1 Tax=Microbispora sp. KK1-11 TaxID=2053005 RepID=UPI001157E89D|nr:DALR anticodon-binding domain-containing protein [Microbispora sp. KK1-11]TQS28818.1 anticodon-binding protein [Microbispora sp. KK1-11]